MSSRRRVIVVIALGLALSGFFALFAYFRQQDRLEQRRLEIADQQAAPADLKALRNQFLEGLESVQEGRASEAVTTLSSFSFEGHVVEEYRLYYLANAHQLAGDEAAARNVLARLWKREPTLVYWPDVGFTLASLYRQSADWRHAAEVYSGIAERSENSAVAAAARSEAMRMRFFAGDPGAAALAARKLLIESAKSTQAPEALNAYRSLTATPPQNRAPLTQAERLDLAKNLLRDGQVQTAYAELEVVTPWNESSRLDLQLQRGIALSQLRRFEESNKVLGPLASSHFKYAIPAIDYASKNFRALAASINPEQIRTIKERRRVGTRKVKKGKRTVRQPVYKTVTRTVKSINAKKKRQKEEYQRLRIERLKDLLQLPTSPALRKQTLLTLIGAAAEKNQDDYMRGLLTELVKIEPASDIGLQRFWDKSWTAYLRGDHRTAQDLLQFIEQTYLNPNVKRQARYWRARSMERTGRKVEAATIYSELASAPYEDLYAKFAISRGGVKDENAQKKVESRSWGEIVEKELPRELLLAYELNALGMARDARLEIQRKVSDENRRYAEAILGDLFFSSGSRSLAFDYMRRAWPSLATVDQDQVPQHFLNLYYPMEYETAIRENARKNKLDPYLVMGLIRQESGFDPEARSRVGASGLMQIMPATGRELAGSTRMFFSDSKLFDPSTNLRLGALYLRQLINRFGGVEELAIAAYNGGQGNVNRWRRGNRRPLDEFIEAIPFSETRNYVKRVTILRSTYKVRDGEPRINLTASEAAGAQP